MTWSDFYLICFLVGFGLSALAFLAGSVHLHLPHLHFHHGVHMPHAHGGGGRADLSWFNFGTIAAFLAWFGGRGICWSVITTYGLPWRWGSPRSAALAARRWCSGFWPRS